MGSKIYILRHGEKPGGHVDNPEDGRGLSPNGKLRATGLTFHYLLPDNPDIIFATRATKHSVRPIKTISPYAATISLTKLYTTYSDAEYQKLADDLVRRWEPQDGEKAKDEHIVICWHHGTIPELIKALGGSTDIKPIKKGKWDETVYDRIIVIEYDDKGKVKKTVSHPQRLLYGDSSN